MTLPIEIFDEIISYINDINNILALRLVCRDFYALTVSGLVKVLVNREIRDINFIEFNNQHNVFSADVINETCRDIVHMHTISGVPGDCYIAGGSILRVLCSRLPNYTPTAWVNGDIDIWIKSSNWIRLTEFLADEHLADRKPKFMFEYIELDSDPTVQLVLLRINSMFNTIAKFDLPHCEWWFDVAAGELHCTNHALACTYFRKCVYSPSVVGFKRTAGRLKKYSARGFELLQTHHNSETDETQYYGARLSDVFSLFSEKIVQIRKEKKQNNSGCNRCAVCSLDHDELDCSRGGQYIDDIFDMFMGI